MPGDPLIYKANLKANIQFVWVSKSTNIDSKAVSDPDIDWYLVKADGVMGLSPMHQMPQSQESYKYE